MLGRGEDSLLHCTTNFAMNQETRYLTYVAISIVPHWSLCLSLYQYCTVLNAKALWKSFDIWQFKSPGVALLSQNCCGYIVPLAFLCAVWNQLIHFHKNTCWDFDWCCNKSINPFGVNGHVYTTRSSNNTFHSRVFASAKCLTNWEPHFLTFAFGGSSHIKIWAPHLWEGRSVIVNSQGINLFIYLLIYLSSAYAKVSFIIYLSW